ncbi:RHS repeat-associated protein [Kibdelosporangium banguiense]|uniref:RHS repeat-associated protein n=1 Tax=Kibdelosporangium banguiense TaxID=1365924 RepID=A0ABS4TRY2_9PSEU|nr:RHS repeat-associated core domain-containing protein [Kibdelosporangium banguiense]MBP2327184.1 RHS repeat-associated protein [Kibdelosporangium banguiense]
MRRAILVAALLAPMIVATPAVADDWTPAKPGDPGPLRTEKPVPGTTMPVTPVRPDPAAAGQVRGNPAVKWPDPGSAEVDLTTPAQRAGSGEEMVRAGLTPVWVGRSGSGPTKIRVNVLERKQVDLAGVVGMAVSLKRTDQGKAAGQIPVRLDYSGFRDAYGGDWAARLRIVALPGCAAETPDKPECRVQKPLRSTNNTKTNTVTAQAEAGPDDTVYALAAGNSGATGDYTATPLSDASKWQVSAQSGSFSWSYPLRTPPVPGGLQPQVALSYGSGSVDGRTASTNNQPTWLGEGWALWSGQITWRFMPCSQDTANGSPMTGDQCWAGDHASVAFNGTASDLVRIGTTNTWRATTDDGTRFEQESGEDNGDHDKEHWKVTTTDGTQYFFGSRPEANSTWNVPVFGNDPNEPCHQNTFEASSCDQAWQWNLDYVVDRRGNTMKYFYDKETNNYGLNLGKVTAPYTRGGTLRRIEYGTRRGSTDSAPAWVEFETADRCVPDSDCGHNPAAQPDVPWDRECTGGPCGDKISPTFWSTKRLSRITTKIRVDGVEKPVDSWTLEHMFPNPGDNTKAALWLQKLTHVGLGGGQLPEPAIEFRGSAYANRVNTETDGQPPLNKFRLEAIYNPTGGVTQIVWEDPDCKPGDKPVAETNTKRCFPVRWVPAQGDVINDWFHKYVVRQVDLTDRVGGGATQVTKYDYVGGAAWHYNNDPLIPADHRTWSQWRGYGKVVVRNGDPGPSKSVVEGKTEYLYYRGMNGDWRNQKGDPKDPAYVVDSQGGKQEDNPGLEGFVRETITYNGVGGPEVTGTLALPSIKQTASKDGLTSNVVRTAESETRTALAVGDPRRTKVLNTYDDFGILTKVEDLGDTGPGKTDDDRCTHHEYARDEANWVLALPSRVYTDGVGCKATPSYPADSISDVKTFYDNADLGVAPTTGTLVRNEQVSGYDTTGKASYAVESTTKYDSYGRVEKSSDALGRETVTAYTTTTGLTTGTTVTDPLGHATTATVDPRWGSTLSSVDVNGRKIDKEYDALGRLTAVWDPGRSKDDGEGPHVRYTYQLRTDGASSIRTDALKANENYISSFELFDGFLRPRQTQKLAWVQPDQPKNSRVVTDVEYDSRGQVARTNAEYTAAGAAGPDLFKVDATADVSAQLVTKYDGTGRPVSAALVSAGVEQWRTTAEYRGDSVATMPPGGGTATTALIDARGQTTKLLQHKELNLASAADATSYTYTKAGQPATMTDAVGNVWTYNYDVRGRRTSSTDPDKGTTTMTYNNAGQLTTQKDARGQTVVFSYDNGGRKTALRKDSETGTALAEWKYDPAGAKGKLASSTSYLNSKPYKFTVNGYDVAYRPISSQVEIPESADPVMNKLAGTYTSGAAYRANGSLVHEKLPKLGTLVSEEVDYEFDDFGMPKKLVGTNTTTYVGLTRYTPFYETEMTRFGLEGAELWEQQDYDRITRRMSSIRVQHRKSTDIQADDTLAYDPSGNVTKLTDATPGAAKDTQCFTYDYLRRVNDAWTSTTDCAGGVGSNLGNTAQYWTTYGYDAIGNRTTENQHTTNTVRTTKYPDPKQPRPHSPLSTKTGANTVTYGYNEIGATTSRPAPTGGTQALTWDEQGRLASAGSSTYVYDADGTRLITKDDKGATLHLASGELRYDTASGTLTGTRVYVHNGSRVAVRTGKNLTDVTYLLQDHHGTDNVAVNASSLQVTRRRLDVFGQSRGAQSPTWPSTKGFVGGTTEAATGLTHIGARSYDPATGKFLSVDPLLSPGDPQGFNAYAYANNNPVTFADSTGLARDRGDNTDCPPGTSSCWAAPPPAPPAQPAPPSPSPRGSDNTRCSPGTYDCWTGPLPSRPNQTKSVPRVQDDCYGPLGDKKLACYTKEDWDKWVDSSCARSYSPLRSDVSGSCKSYDKRRKANDEENAREDRKNRELAKQAKQAELEAKKVNTVLYCGTVNLVIVGFERCQGTDKQGTFFADSMISMPLALGVSGSVRALPGQRSMAEGVSVWATGGARFVEVGGSATVLGPNKVDTDPSHWTTSYGGGANIGLPFATGYAKTWIHTR